MDEKGKTALWEEYSQTKDPKIREKLILQYSELVKIVAGRYYRVGNVGRIICYRLVSLR